MVQITMVISCYNADYCDTVINLVMVVRWYCHGSFILNCTIVIYKYYHYGFRKSTMVVYTMVEKSHGRKSTAPKYHGILYHGGRLLW